MERGDSDSVFLSILPVVFAQSGGINAPSKSVLSGSVSNSDVDPIIVCVRALLGKLGIFGT